MGEQVLAAYGIAALLGVILIVAGALRKSRLTFLAGVAMLLALVGAWVVGPVGVVLAAAVIPFLLVGSKGKKAR